MSHLCNFYAICSRMRVHNTVPLSDNERSDSHVSVEKVPYLNRLCFGSALLMCFQAQVLYSVDAYGPSKVRHGTVKFGR